MLWLEGVKQKFYTCPYQIQTLSKIRYFLNRIIVIIFNCIRVYVQTYTLVLIKAKSFGR